jgi:potassium voltage-gated channel Shal-related subfamily D protein 2
MLGFNPEDEDHFAVAQGMRSDWRRRLYLLMEEPSSGREAFFVHIMVTGGIIFRWAEYLARLPDSLLNTSARTSALLTTLSTLPSFHTDPSHIRALFGLDTTIVVLFTIEYLARTLAHSDSWTMYYNWATSFFPLLDFIAILPYYIEVAREQDTSILFRFAILRTFRLLRVFRAFKYQNQMLLTIEVMYVAVQRSKDALVALSFFILLVLVFFSTLIYFAERGTWDASLQAFVDADGDPSQFDSIPQTAWFALVTMSTVGYGDVVPRSSLGKLLSMPLLMFGLLLIALPSFVLGRNFAIVFDAMTSQANNKPVSWGRSRHILPCLTRLRSAQASHLDRRTTTRRPCQITCPSRRARPHRLHCYRRIPPTCPRAPPSPVLGASPPVLLPPLPFKGA